MSAESDKTLHVNATVSLVLHGSRMDQAAAALFPDFSRSKLQQWIKEGAMTLDGAPVRPRDKVAVDQTLVLKVVQEAEVFWAGEDMPLEIIYEDADLMVINKPAGLVVHPAAGHASGTLVNALLNYAPELARLPRGGIVHRLDKDTSGTMFVARSSVAHQSLVAQLADRSVKREYAAVCIGTVTGGGTISAPMGRHAHARTKMAVVNNGKSAITHYRVKERFGHHTHLAVTLETGRTHQIRVHMAYKHHPLVGDPVYGGRPRIPAGASEPLITGLRAFPRQALHARTLAFDHPQSGQRLTFETDLPDDFEALLSLLRAEDSPHASR